jgi:hypothetical protein
MKKGDCPLFFTILTPKMRGGAKIKADQDPLRLEIFGNR